MNTGRISRNKESDYKAAADAVPEADGRRKDSVRKTEQLFELYKFTNVTNQTSSK